MPDRAILMLCPDCSQRTRRIASDRADDTDYPRMVQLARALAGEVWTDGDLTYWMREPLTTKRQPDSIPTWVPQVELPKPHSKVRGLPR